MVIDLTLNRRFQGSRHQHVLKVWVSSLYHRPDEPKPIRAISSIPPSLQAACAHLSRTASVHTDLRSAFYLSWCSWSPRGLGHSRPHTPRNETPRCGTGSRCTPRSPACTRWVTALGPRSRCIYILRRCCQSCSSRCRTGCSSGQCTQFCICHTLGQFHQALKNTESKSGTCHFKLKNITFELQQFLFLGEEKL